MNYGGSMYINNSIIATVVVVFVLILVFLYLFFVKNDTEKEKYYIGTSNDVDIWDNNK
jgi:uncharacterized membrane protein